MTDSQNQHGVVITLREVWEQGQETRELVGGLAKDVGELVAVNKRLDAHSKTLADHDGRLDKLEVAQATAEAIVNARYRPHTPWYAVVGAVVGIVTGVGSLITLIVLLGQISRALTH